MHVLKTVTPPVENKTLIWTKYIPAISDGYQYRIYMKENGRETW